MTPILTLLSLPSRIFRLPSSRSCRVSSGEVPGMGAVRSSRRNSFSSCREPGGQHRSGHSIALQLRRAQPTLSTSSVLPSTTS